MGKFIDLTKQKFNMLEVQHRDGSAGSDSAWVCICDCGKTTRVAASALKSGATKSCGCLRAKGRKISTDFTGQKFGKMLVTGQDLTKPKPGVWWLMTCDCGNTISVHSANVRRYTACGCERRLPDGHAAKNAVIGGYKRQARLKKREWALSDDEFFTFTQALCHYCGSAPKQTVQVSAGTGQFVYNGVDRKNNDLGYTGENCVSCCGFCNMMKEQLPYETFVNWLIRAGRFQSTLVPDQSPANPSHAETVTSVCAPVLCENADC